MFIDKYRNKLQLVFDPTNPSRFYNIGIVTFSPKDATYILENLNGNNRGITKVNSNNLKSELETGNFKLNGETIIFSPEGNLLDGQHRLTACSVTKVPLTSFIIIGISEELFHTIDIGSKRSNSDVLHIKGYKDTSSLAAAIQPLLDLFAEYKNLFPTQYHTVLEQARRETHQFAASTKACLLVAGAIPELPLIVAQQRKYSRSGIGTRAVRSALTFLFEIKNKKDSDEFWEQVAGGLHLAQGSSTYRVRELLRSYKTGSKKRKEETILIIKAWNAFRSKTMLKLPRDITELTKANYPKIL
jgi:hypothetical protein